MIKTDLDCPPKKCSGHGLYSCYGSYAYGYKSSYYISPGCDVVKYFRSRLIYFHELQESENEAWE